MSVQTLDLNHNKFYNIWTQAGVELVDWRHHIDGRFDEVDRRFDEVDKRFEEVDRRFDELNTRIDNLGERMDTQFAELRKLIATLK